MYNAHTISCLYLRLCFTVFFFLFDYTYVCLGMCACERSVHRSWKWVSSPMVVSRPAWELGIKLRSTERAVCALPHPAISPAAASLVCSTQKERRACLLCTLRSCQKRQIFCTRFILWGMNLHLYRLPLPVLPWSTLCSCARCL